MKIDKSGMMGGNGKPLTTGLFIDLEDGISENAVFTKDEMDKKIGDKTFYSFKRLFVECGDPTGYDFAKKYLMGWQHYKSMKANKKVNRLIEEALEEIEIQIRSEAIATAQGLSAEGNAAMTKFLAERGWEKGKVGRPTKDTTERNERITARLTEEYKGDLVRLASFRS